MWSCNKCHAVNEDLYTICPKCGASRSAGRFGSAAQPIVRNAAAPAPENKPPQPKSTPEVAAPSVAYYEPDLSKIHAGRSVRILGRILIILLPLLTLAYFAAQFNGPLFVSVTLAFFRLADTLPAFIPIISTATAFPCCRRFLRFKPTCNLMYIAYDTVIICSMERDSHAKCYAYGCTKKACRTARRTETQAALFDTRKCSCLLSAPGRNAFIFLSQSERML